MELFYSKSSLGRHHYPHIIRDRLLAFLPVCTWIGLLSPAAVVNRLPALTREWRKVKMRVKRLPPARERTRLEQSWERPAASKKVLSAVDSGISRRVETDMRTERRLHSEKVILLPDVITKSMCQPREILVDIFQEYPEDTEHIYIPSCVVLNRCGGCCNDEAMECVSMETRNVTLQVTRLRLLVTQHTVHLSFTEHQKCYCRLKPDVQAKKQ
uniref:Platelet-derived growth factor (PDGF) family profile domain-containing protein n=1 Tax=Gasterosteus aculeatus aculeatus TaxID=481459 RepID=A0AAQ4R3T2_GASAC